MINTPNNNTLDFHAKDYSLQKRFSGRLIDVFDGENSLFLEKLQNTPQGTELINSIHKLQKSQAFDRRDELKDILPNLCNLGVPLVQKNKFNIEDYKTEWYKKLDKAISLLPTEIKKEFSVLVPYFNIGSGGWSINYTTDGAFNIGDELEQYSSIREVTALFMHELTHIKHIFAELAFNDFSQISKELNRGFVESSNKDQVLEVGMGKPIWLIKNQYSLNEIILDNNQGIIREYRFNDDIELDIHFTMSNMGSRHTKNKLTSIEMGGPHELKKYYEPLLQPRNGFISPYSIYRGYKEGIYYQDLLINNKSIQIFDEEFTEIVEHYYKNPENFKQIMLSSTNNELISLEEKYDQFSSEPILRKKLRLMIKYGFFPKNEFQGYFFQK